MKKGIGVWVVLGVVMLLIATQYGGVRLSLDPNIPSVYVMNSQGGRIKVNDYDSLGVGHDYAVDFNLNDAVTITAIPDSGYTLKELRINDQPVTANPYSFTITTNTVVSGVFIDGSGNPPPPNNPFAWLTGSINLLGFSIPYWMLIILVIAIILVVGKGKI